MKRFLTRGAVVVGLTMALGIGLAAPAAAHETCCTSSYSASTLAAKMEWRADTLRYKASRMPYVTVLGSSAKTTLATRLTNGATALDALADATRTVTSQSALDAKYAEYKALLSRLAPTLRATKQAFYGTALRAKARYYTAKAAALQVRLDAKEATRDISATDAIAVQAMIDTAKARLALARAALTPSVLGVRIMTDADHASSTLTAAAKRIYVARWWLRHAAYALYYA